MGGDVLSRGVAVHDVALLAELRQNFDQRIIPVENHSVVKIVVDPGFNDLFDIGKVDHHAAEVRLISLDIYLDAPVVPVKMPTFAFVV
jgi:hypothetical protein